MRRYQLAAFVVAGVFAGSAGGLFGIFNRGVFPDFCYWSKSAEVADHGHSRRHGPFWGPAVGAAILIVLNQQITSYTEYWPLMLGLDPDRPAVRVPGGIVGTLMSAVERLRARPASDPLIAPETVKRDAPG